jgi:excinuclease ABC subunit A
MEKPKYEQLRGLSPTIAIEQKSASSNPRSTVGTVTEIYDYLRVLYARAGEQRCHLCGGIVTARSAAEIVAELMTLPPKTKAVLMARKAENRKGEFKDVFDEARKAGFVRVRINGLIQRLEDVTALDKKKKHTIEIVIDRVTIDPAERARISDSVETAVKAGGGAILVAVEGESQDASYSEARACPKCGVGLPELSPSRSRSTARWACASTAMAWAPAWRSIPNWWSPTPTCPSRMAPSNRGEPGPARTAAGPPTSPPRCRASSGFRSTNPGRA